MLEITNLVAGYGKVKVLHAINLEVPNGKLVTLIGSNGAGKTTTLRAVSGMIKPESGDIRLNGQSIAGLPSHEITRRGLAHSPEGRRVFPTLTVTDNLLLGAFPRLTKMRPKGDVDADLNRMFDLFPRLRERKEQLAGTLSGGEQQMLAIGRGLMSEPKLIILDEPSLGLSPIMVEEMFGMITAVNRDGVAVLLVEQNVIQSLSIASRAYVLEQGRFAMEGDAASLLANPGLRQAYLGL